MAKVYKLPTKSSRKYRGKYPTRIHHASWGGREEWLVAKYFPDMKYTIHIEMNNGDRYIADADELLLIFPMIGGMGTTSSRILYTDAIAIVNAATDMGELRYKAWLRDVQAARTLWDSDRIRELQYQKTQTSGHQARARIEEQMIAYVKAGVEEMNKCSAF